MKITKYILAFLILFSACFTGQEGDFFSFIGEEKSRIIKQADKSYSKFLKDNFDGSDDFERTLNFLTFFDTTTTFEDNWVVDLDEAGMIVSQYENSGLRKDFLLYGYEEYEAEYFAEFKFDSLLIDADEEEILYPPSWDSAQIKAEIQRDEEHARKLKQRSDSFPDFNVYGRYIYGLEKYYATDSVVNKYVSFKQMGGSGFLSTSILVGGLKRELEETGELTEGTRIIFLFELYFPILGEKIQLH